MSDKGLISRLYKEFLKIDLTKKGRQPTEKWAKDRLFHKTRHPNKHMGGIINFINQQGNINQNQNTILRHL